MPWLALGRVGRGVPFIAVDNLDTLLREAAAADARVRIEFRDRIAAFGSEAIARLEPWKRLVRIAKAAGRDEREAWQSIVIGVSRGLLGRRFDAFVYPQYRNTREAVPLGSAGSFDGVARKLAKKLGAPEASLREARAALESVG
jgi:hypothetical protein